MLRPIILMFVVSPQHNLRRLVSQRMKALHNSWLEPTMEIKWYIKVLYITFPSSGRQASNNKCHDLCPHLTYYILLVCQKTRWNYQTHFLNLRFTSGWIGPCLINISTLWWKHMEHPVGQYGRQTGPSRTSLLFTTTSITLQQEVNNDNMRVMKPIWLKSNWNVQRDDGETTRRERQLLDFSPVPMEMASEKHVMGESGEYQEPGHYIQSQRGQRF